MSLAHVHTGDGRWPDIREQPRCANCGHRRIYHYRGTYGAHRTLIELDTRCSLPVHDWPCGCDSYQPVGVLHAVGES